MIESEILRGPDAGSSRLRLVTIVRLRWIAIIGQLATILAVQLMGFELPLVACLLVVGLSVALNLLLQFRFGNILRLRTRDAFLMLGFDILQLAFMLFLTGGLQNPFALLLVVPVAVSGSTQPLRVTIALAALAMACGTVLLELHWPFPWYRDQLFVFPYLYETGLWTALVSCIAFVAFYTYRTASETRAMSNALAAAELVLAREQRLSALDGLAAAAAHELGTPLSTISVIARELEREMPAGSPHHDDIRLLRNQAVRCREILTTLTRNSGEQVTILSVQGLGHLLTDVIEAHDIVGKEIAIALQPQKIDTALGLGEPQVRRNPAIIYGLSNLVENAIDFARSKVDIVAQWDASEVTLYICDDGPGFAPGILTKLGEPYITTRPQTPLPVHDGHEGMGLGFFIAKTLLERAGAQVTFANRTAPQPGAMIKIVWPRAALEAELVPAIAAQ